MHKSKPIPRSEVKGIRHWGSGVELEMIDEATPLARLKRQVATAAKNPRAKGILLEILKK